MMRQSIAFMLISVGLAGMAFSQQYSFQDEGTLMVGVLKHTLNAPGKDVAPDLRRFWLWFHENEVCQGVDASFVFYPDGVEIWCQVEEERSFQKLTEMAVSLRRSWRVVIYATRLTSADRGTDKKDPPPSLWNNEELRSFFRDALGHDAAFANSAAPSGAGHLPDGGLKQRLFMYASQIQEQEKRVQRYAADIEELAAASWGAGAAPDLRARAVSICLAHAQGMSRYAEKLAENLSHAMPRASKKLPQSAEPPKATPACTPLYCAFQLSLMGRNIARRVDRFLYPKHHTVEITDLRDPNLLESLRMLRSLVSDFERRARK